MAVTHPTHYPAVTYPAHREADIALRDGSTVHVRPIRPDDEQRLLDLLTSLSPDARTLRFFSAGRRPRRARPRRQPGRLRPVVGLVATTGPDERIVGHAFVCAARRRARRDRIHDRRRVPGAWTRHPAARPAGRDGRRQRDRRVSRHGAPVELPHARRLSRLGLPGGHAHRPRRDPPRAADIADTEAVERFERREQIGAVNALTHVLRPTLDRRDRGIAAAGHRGRRRVSQPPRRRVRRPGLSGQPEGRGRAERARLPDRGGRPGPGRPGGDRRPGGLRAGGRGAVRPEGGPGARRADGRLRRDGRRRAASGSKPSSDCAERPACV